MQKWGKKSVFRDEVPGGVGQNFHEVSVTGRRDVLVSDKYFAITSLHQTTLQLDGKAQVGILLDLIQRHQLHFTVKVAQTILCQQGQEIQSEKLLHHRGFRNSSSGKKDAWIDYLTISQSIDRTINQSINQSNDQWLDKLINQSINRSNLL